MEKQGQENLRKLLKSVSEDKDVYSRVPELIVTICNDIARIVGDTHIYISEFIIAKVKGKIGNLGGHPEITDEIFLQIPKTIHNPHRIYLDQRTDGRTKYLFVENIPPHQIVIEVRRFESGKTEINTIIPLGNRTLKQLEGHKDLQVVFSRHIGESATTPSSLSQQGLSGVNGYGDMIEKNEDESK